jgi:YegS/Rv2252/BmrU family lipid kinase
MAGRGTARAQGRLSEAASALPQPDAHCAGASRPERTALLFANVASRQGATDVAPVLEVLRAGGVRVLEESPADVHQLGGWILEHRAKADLVIIGGGDGTLNAAADALVEAGLPLGILPLGTANDLARTLEIPSSPIEAGRVIAAGQTRRIDLGRINGKHFFNVASIGLSVHVARQLDGDVKRRWGVLGYPLTLWRTLGHGHSFRAEIRCDGKRARVRTMQISVGNGRYYGGGMTIAADATIDDGMLDVVSLAPQGLLELILNLPALRWGWHQRLEQVRHWRGREIEIRTGHVLPVNTDGEVTTRTPAKVVVVPQALAVCVPQSRPERSGADHAEG